MKFTNVNNVLLYSTDDMVVKDARQGWFERNTFKCFFELLTKLYPKPQNFCAIDIGAYTGVYSLYFSRFCGFRQVYAFEPNPTAYSRLIDNVKLNNISSLQFQPSKYAVGDVEWEEIELYHKNFRMTSASSLEKTDETVNSTTVNIISLDSFNPNEPVAIIKIDVESREKQVLLGAKNVIQEHMPILIIETLTKESEQEVVDILTQYGYDTNNMHFGLDDRNMIAYHPNNI